MGKTQILLIERIEERSTFGGIWGAVRRAPGNHKVMMDKHRQDSTS